MPETSLFDEPLGPPAPEPPAEFVEPPAKPARKRRAPKSRRDDDADLDAQLTQLVPDVADPGYEGHKLRVQGYSWVEIAKAIGSSTPRGAVTVVSRYLQDAAKAQSATQLQEALQTQVDRYEAILKAWWPAALDDLDEKAATVVLRTLERLDRVLRIVDGDVSVSRETIVVSANPAEYVKQLQGVVAARNGGKAVDEVEAD
jgi:hypothetical protein